MSPDPEGGCALRFTRPKPSLVIAALVAMALLLGLGFWQLDRLQQKRVIIEKIAAGAVARPVPAPGYGKTRNSDMQYRRVFATGIYRHDLEIQVYAIGGSGAPGFRVFTPLERDTDGVILVNRGWVAQALKDPRSRREGLARGVVTIEGILRNPGVQGRFTPENSPRKNAWFWLDMELVAAERGLEELSYYILQAAADPGSPGPPRGSTSGPYVANNHFGYMLTWFSLALTLALIFAIYHRRKAD